MLPEALPRGGTSSYTILGELSGLVEIINPLCAGDASISISNRSCSYYSITNDSGHVIGLRG